MELPSAGRVASFAMPMQRRDAKIAVCFENARMICLGYLENFLRTDISRSSVRQLNYPARVDAEERE
jgi:hypothetical protein